MSIDADKYPLFLQMGPALARRQDPLTSERASTWLRGSGKLARQERAVFQALKDHPGSTARELAAILACEDPNIPARRLAGLADRGLVRRGPKRACRISRMLCQTWYAVEQQKTGTLPRPQDRRTLAKPSVSGPVLTPEQRRAMHERLAAEGNEDQKRFLSALCDGASQ